MASGSRGSGGRVSRSLLWGTLIPCACLSGCLWGSPSPGEAHPSYWQEASTSQPAQPAAAGPPPTVGGQVRGTEAAAQRAAAIRASALAEWEKSQQLAGLIVVGMTMEQVESILAERHSRTSANFDYGTDNLLSKEYFYDLSSISVRYDANNKVTRAKAWERKKPTWWDNVVDAWHHVYDI